MIKKNTRTKIVATIGPACADKIKISELIEAGVSCFRFNMKHGTLDWHEQKIKLVRQVSSEMKQQVAILMDLQGPEVRIGRLPGGMIKLEKNDQVWLTNSEVQKDGGRTITIDRTGILENIKVGQKILIDDGFLAFKVIKVDFDKQTGYQAKLKVLEGGELKERKGINIPGLVLNIPVLIKRDLQCLSISNKQDIDWVALSFVSSGKDILQLKRELKKRGIKAGVIAKIERKEAIDNFEEILEIADAVMVARGDLGVEISIYEVPYWQKHIIQRCREEGKPVITATQMLQSMCNRPLPTRAEISDIANSVYDGTDAVMLSAETASGRYPLKAVKVMRKEIEFIENKIDFTKLAVSISNGGQTEAVVAAADSLIRSEKQTKCSLKAVVVLTETGTTARYLSRSRPKLPILAVTDNKKTRDKMNLFWGVEPFYFPYSKLVRQSAKDILGFLKSEGQLKKGDRVVMIYGDNWGKKGLTNCVRIESVV